MSWASEERNPYENVAIVTGEFVPSKNEIKSFTIVHGTSALIRNLIDRFLKDMDSAEINIDEGKSIDDEERRYGGRRESFTYFFISISVLKEDLEKIDSDSPIKISLATNVHPKNKKAFIDFFKKIADILSW